MAKTATLNVRVDPDVKAEATKVLDDLGISMSSALNMILRNIARRKRLPLESVTLEDYGILNMDNMTDEEFMTDEELVDLVNKQEEEEPLEECKDISELYKLFNYTPRK